LSTNGTISSHFCQMVEAVCKGSKGICGGVQKGGFCRTIQKSYYLPKGMNV